MTLGVKKEGVLQSKFSYLFCIDIVRIVDNNILIPEVGQKFRNHEDSRDRGTPVGRR
jgi:hypothetical protein